MKKHVLSRFFLVIIMMSCTLTTLKVMSQDNKKYQETYRTIKSTHGYSFEVPTFLESSPNQEKNADFSFTKKGLFVLVTSVSEESTYTEDFLKALGSLSVNEIKNNTDADGSLKLQVLKSELRYINNRLSYCEFITFVVDNETMYKEEVFQIINNKLVTLYTMCPNKEKWLLTPFIDHIRKSIR